MSQWTERPELAAYLERQRWFGEREGGVTISSVQELGWLTVPADGVRVRFELVTAGALYSVPLSYRSQPREDLSYGFVGAATLDGEVFYVYDAMHDPEARAALLAGFTPGATTPSDLTYETLEGQVFEDGAESVLMNVQQSNTSVIVGESLVKFFRKLETGRNPDIEVQAALTRLGSEQISPLLGWISTGDVDLAMVGVYQRSATDGWEFARSSIRGLQADEVRARDAGGDFAGESERLGETLALVHDEMRQSLPTAVWDSDEVGALVDRLTARLDRALAMDDAVANFADSVRAAYAAIDVTVPVPVQRIHGDFHLGQTLRTTTGWKIIDFEGEPAQALSDRVRLDSVTRDVAGMLRSLDYAAHSVAIASAEIVGASDDSTYIADWVRRNRVAFLRGYGFENSEAAATMLHAYEIDKAVYEFIYESHYRPDWVQIPLQALNRLL